MLEPAPLDEPLPMLDAPLPMLELLLPDWLLPVEPLALEPLLVLLCLWCFFLVDFLCVDEVLVLPVPVWSCAVALVSPLVEELPLVCACAFMAPHIATATDAPNRPFSNLFIFMSLS
jgi:signal-induced proliferation-associated 1 like protein 3